MRLRRHPPVLDGATPLPDPRTANEDGLVAVGGDLSVERLREAYAHGIFPWSATPPTWWSPDPRAVIELDALHVSRRLRQKLKQGRFRATFDQAFDRVILGCAQARREDDSTWISPVLAQAYLAFHRAGFAHSVEVWSDDRLAGGLYGVALGGVFAGESMFHVETDASKAALYFLVEHLRERGFVLFDTQVANAFTLQMGATEIPREEFLQRLKAGLRVEATF